ncbi:class I adenylate-forming enzyme family protein [Phenylobacterium sp.]|uniref:class I adenylate-forming enzyme family protein n=1 Tax=Phenylobacterium sp. TaxID=1871053 RepID=UPI0027378889|nr:class I adenylate-forming enzyme family protein [Phenylobacterium sp.]MDP3867552.1 class I adenylate-forming enzyme family protein [Phenylobacterium sp.]
MILAPADRIADYRAKGWWGDVRMTDLFDAHVRIRGDAMALVDPPNTQAIVGRLPQSLTWTQLADAVERLMAVLTDYGVGKDDVVLVQLPNIAELTMAYLACFKLGVIVTPAPVQYRENELEGIVRRTGAKAAITAARIGGQDHAGALVGLPALGPVFSLGAAPGALDLAVLMAEASPSARKAAREAAEAARVTADDIATICWTSGTEAEPKGVPRSHNEWLIMAEGVVGAAGLADGARLLNPFPMVNMAGISTALAGWLLVGGTLVQHQPFDLATMLGQIRDHAIDYTVAPPAVLNLLLQDPKLLEGIDFSRLRSIGSGSAPLSEGMIRTFHDRYGVEIVNYFGSNEGMSLCGTAKDIPDPRDRGAFFPRVGAPGHDWAYPLNGRFFSRLVDPNTAQEITAAGQPGEMRIKGPTVFSGYWRAPELTARAFDAEGWFRTGDLFEIAGDHDQFYRFVGRLKDIVIRGGVNISSEEVEGHLVAHPDILEAAVVGAPDARLGERLCAFVVAKAGAPPTREAINAFLINERKVAVFKQIERLEIATALPRNPLGKVLKRQLRESLSEASPVQS